MLFCTVAAGCAECVVVINGGSTYFTDIIIAQVFPGGDRTEISGFRASAAERIGAVAVFCNDSRASRADTADVFQLEYIGKSRGAFSSDTDRAVRKQYDGRSVAGFDVNDIVQIIDLTLSCTVGAARNNSSVCTQSDGECISCGDGSDVFPFRCSGITLLVRIVAKTGNRSVGMQENKMRRAGLDRNDIFQSRCGCFEGLFFTGRCDGGVADNAVRHDGHGTILVDKRGHEMCRCHGGNGGFLGQIGVDALLDSRYG